MKAYCIGKSIILPQVRYVNHGSSRRMLMFHSEVVRIDGEHRTLGCHNMDDSGFCLGHKISREEFIERYCGGIEPIPKWRQKRNERLNQIMQTIAMIFILQRFRY